MATNKRQASLNTIRMIGGWGIIIGLIVIVLINVVFMPFVMARDDEMKHVAQEIERCSMMIQFTGLIIASAILYATSFICESIQAANKQ